MSSNYRLNGQRIDELLFYPNIASVTQDIKGNYNNKYKGGTGLNISTRNPDVLEVRAPEIGIKLEGIDIGQYLSTLYVADFYTTSENAQPNIPSWCKRIKATGMGGGGGGGGGGGASVRINYTYEGSKTGSDSYGGGGGGGGCGGQVTFSGIHTLQGLPGNYLVNIKIGSGGTGGDGGTIGDLDETDNGGGEQPKKVRRRRGNEGRDGNDGGTTVVYIYSNEQGVGIIGFDAGGSAGGKGGRWANTGPLDNEIKENERLLSLNPPQPIQFPDRGPGAGGPGGALAATEVRTGGNAGTAGSAGSGNNGGAGGGGGTGRSGLSNTTNGGAGGIGGSVDNTTTALPGAAGSAAAGSGFCRLYYFP